MSRRVPDGPPPEPVVQRLRIRYAKRGRLRFSSHRDFARAFERALRRAGVPMAYSGGFTPHPKIAYVGAAPTGVASEAEYLEIGVTREVDPAHLRAALDDALPDGLDIDEVVVARGGSLAERMQASVWRVELPGVPPPVAREALTAFLSQTSYPVERLTKTGRRTIDARTAVVSAAVREAGTTPNAPDGPASPSPAILEMVVRQVTPAVRPDDVLAALRGVAGLALAAPPLAVRLAQGPIDDVGSVGDPLSADRNPVETSP